MAKILLALAALAAAGAVDAQSFQSMLNPGTAKCLVAGTYNAELETFALQAGACTSPKAVKIRHLGNGKALKTDKGFCVGTAKPSNKAGTKLILDECLSGALGQKWTKVGNKQWRNGYNQCLENAGGNIVQKTCKTLASDDVTSTQQWVFVSKPTPPPPPPPAPTEINCYDWLNKYTCPVNYAPILKPQAMTCVGATDNTCYSVCCKKDTPRTCPSQVRCAAGYSVVNQPCGRPGQPCDQSYCCTPDIVTCRRWNMCAPGSQLIADARLTECAYVNTPIAPRCSQDYCCQPFLPPPPPPPANYYCKDYFKAGNTCEPDYRKTPDAATTQCDPSVDQDCYNMCCKSDIITCEAYFENPNNVCKPDFSPIEDAPKIKCDTTIDGDCDNMCCYTMIPLPASS